MQELKNLGSALGWCCLLVSLAALPTGFAEGSDDSLVGYDCAQSSINPLAVDQVFNSPGAADNKRTVTKEAQLIQTRREVKIKVHTCRVERRLEVLRHNLANPVSVVSSKHVLGKAECEQLHATGKLTLGKDVIAVTQNATTVKVLIKAGDMADDGSWSGGEYVHEGEKYTNVLATETVTIELGERYAETRPEMNTLSLSLRSGYVAYGSEPEYSAGYYFDRETSTTVVWDSSMVRTSDSCMSDWYDVIYEGPINMVMYVNDNGGTTFILVPVGDQVVAFRSYGQGEKCGFSQWSTDDGSLMVVEKDPTLGYMVQSSEKNPSIQSEPPMNFADHVKRKSVFQTVSPARKTAILQRLVDPLRSKSLLLWDFPDSRLVAVQPRLDNRAVQQPFYMGSSQAYVLKCLKVTVTPRTVDVACKQFKAVNYNGEPWFLVKPSLILTKEVSNCSKA